MSFDVDLKPKIAILTINNSYQYGGIATCLNLVHDFCKQYFDPTVFYLSFDPEISASLKSLKFSSEYKSVENNGMKTVQIGAKWAFWQPGHYVYNLPIWKEVLKDYEYFFVVSGTSITAYPLVLLDKNFPMWIASPFDDDRKQRRKELSFTRSIIDKFATFKLRKIEKEILLRSDFIWALSKYVRLRINEILKTKRDNVLICNYPMEVRNCNFQINKKAKQIIAVGRFSDPRKNIKMLLRVFDKLYKNDSELKLYVVGSKPEEKDIVSFVKLPSFKNIIFTGQVDEEKLSNLYQTSSLMLITSHQEGLGIVGLQAMSYEVPVVATDCGGTSDFVVDGKNGFLVKINDDNEMVKKSLKILSSDELRVKMGLYAKKFIKDHLSKEKIYSIFKIGLTRVYPELKDVFKSSAKEELLKLNRDNEYEQLDI